MIPLVSQVESSQLILSRARRLLSRHLRMLGYDEAPNTIDVSSAAASPIAIEKRRILLSTRRRVETAFTIIYRRPSSRKIMTVDSLLACGRRSASATVAFFVRVNAPPSIDSFVQSNSCHMQIRALNRIDSVMSIIRFSLLGSRRFGSATAGRRSTRRKQLRFSAQRAIAKGRPAGRQLRHHRSKQTAHH